MKDKAKEPLVTQAMATLYLQKSSANAPNAGVFSPEVDFDSYEIDHNSLSILLRGKTFTNKEAFCSGYTDDKIKKILSEALEAEGESHDPWMVDLSEYRGLEINRFKGTGGLGFLEKAASVLSGNFGPISGYMFILSHNQVEEGIRMSVLFPCPCFLVSTTMISFCRHFLQSLAGLEKPSQPSWAWRQKPERSPSHILTKFGLARTGAINRGANMPEFLR